jgi:C-terminal processing protease CtpA/Prc
MKIIQTLTTWGLISAAALFLASCEKGPDEKQVDKAPVPLNSIFLSEPEGVPDSKNKCTFTVTSDADWTLTINNDWITSDIDGGSAGIWNITLTIAPNPDSENSRTGTVTAANDLESVDFTVYQGNGAAKWGYNPTGISKGVNLSVWQHMYKFYYWNNAVEELTPATFPADKFKLPVQTFLKDLIESLDWNKVQDTSNGENPPSIDGQWNANRTRRDHIYSYIQPIGYSTRAGTRETSFGFGIDYFQKGTSAFYETVISWVQPDGPADQKGLKRGTVITGYASGTGTPAELSVGKMEDFYNHLYRLDGGNTMTLEDKDGGRYTIQYSTGIVSPIIGDKMITSPGGRKVAYFAYSQFVGGDYQGSGNFRKAMRDAFGRYRSSGAQDLVLDLRYNGGGEVSVCQSLTSLIGDVNDNMVFGKMLHNDNAEAWSDYYNDENYDNPEIIHFSNEPNSLKLRRVYCLMTKGSASASEMVVNALKGVDGFEVIIIGGETNGKNVGMDVFRMQDNTYTYAFAPITFKILNAKDFCDYAGGFQPNYRIDEFRALDTTPGVHSGIYELGDPNEELLKAALLHIDGRPGEIVQDTRTRVDEYYDPLRATLIPPTRDMVMHTFDINEDGTVTMVE